MIGSHGRSPHTLRPPLLARLRRRLAAAAERARTRVCLDRLDDRMLRDMGISRADVDTRSRR